MAGLSGGGGGAQVSFCPLAPGVPERTGVFLFCLVPGTKTGAHNTLFHLGGSREWGRGGGGRGKHKEMEKWRESRKTKRNGERESGRERNKDLIVCLLLIKRQLSFYKG